MKQARDPLYRRQSLSRRGDSYAVWLYFRFPLSLRMVEEMLAAHGIDVSHESVRHWAEKFGREFANRIRRRAPARGGQMAYGRVVIHDPRQEALGYGAPSISRASFLDVLVGGKEFPWPTCSDKWPRRLSPSGAAMPVLTAVVGPPDPSNRFCRRSFPRFPGASGSRRRRGRRSERDHRRDARAVLGRLGRWL